LQRFTRRSARHPKSLEPLPATHCTEKPHRCLDRSLPNCYRRKPAELRIAIALQTSANIFENTECSCGKFVDRLGLHDLSCIKNAGRFPRHSAINSIPKRSLTCTGLPSVLEPVGLVSDIRPDGLTLNPWYRGRSIEWDIDSCGHHCCRQSLHSQCRYTRQCSN